MREAEVQPRNTMALVLLYLACFLLVVLYANLFPVWSLVAKSFAGIADYLPFLAVLAAGLALYGGRLLLVREKSLTVRRGWLLCGCLLAVAALLLPDPRFPVKRVHVAEYGLLALLVRYILAGDLRGPRLVVFTTVITGLFGVHDELLQGLLPTRTFGLRDIGVNTLGGAAGACVAHGLRLFSGSVAAEPTPRETGTESRKLWSLVALVLPLVLLSLICTLFSLLWYRQTTIPWWTMAPLLGGVAGLGIVVPDLVRCRALLRSVLPIYGLVAAMLIYPLVVNHALVTFF